MAPKEPDWVQLQQKTMIRWINQKIQNDTATPTSSLNIPNQINNLHSDLQDGLVLVRLVNQIIHEVSNTPNHHLITSQLFYLTPLYPKPNFKLQKIENLNDFLKFIKLIFNINVSTVSSDNIFDGDLKLTLGLVWSLFLFSTSTSFLTFSNSSPSFVEIKTIIINWINKIISKRNIQITNLNKDWSVEIHRPDHILSIILQHYNITLSEEKNRIQNLLGILKYGEQTLKIPHLIDIDDFRLLVPDEKCIVTYLIEWFKIFEIEKSYQTKPRQLYEYNKFNDLIELINITVKFKNKYETKALRFLNRLNSFTSQLDQDYMYLENSFMNEEKSAFIEENEASGRLAKSSFTSSSLTIAERDTSSPHTSSPPSAHNASNFSTTLEMFHTYKTSIKPELLYQDYPELQNYLNIIDSNLCELNLIYSPLIKHLNMENLSRKVSLLNESETKICKMIQAVLVAYPSLATTWDSKTTTNNTDKTNKTPENITQTFNLNSNFYNDFRTKFINHENELTHFELIKFLRTSIVTLELESQSLETFIKLLPLKTRQMTNSGSSYSISDSDFSLISSSSLQSITSTSSEDDFIFDEIQQKLDSQLSGTLDKVYDIVEFIHKLENGFNV
jgi:hypothetical protein